MIIDKISDLIVFGILKNINHGFLRITNFDGEVFKFGNINDQLKAEIFIKHPSLNYNLIRKGYLNNYLWIDEKGRKYLEMCPVGRRPLQEYLPAIIKWRSDCVHLKS